MPGGLSSKNRFNAGLRPDDLDDVSVAIISRAATALGAFPYKGDGETPEEFVPPTGGYAAAGGRLRRSLGAVFASRS